MTPPPMQSADRLARAIQIHHDFLEGKGPRHVGDLLLQHEDLRDILEPLLQDGCCVEPADIGEYRILRELGRGGMGVVYEAEQASLGRRVALKVLPGHAFVDARAVARFKREAQLAASLDHPGITKVFATGQHEGQHWFAMEMVRGTPLSKLLEALCTDPAAPAAAERFVKRMQEPGRVPSPDASPAPVSAPRRGGLAGIAVDLAIQVADALACAHAAGIVHRDVKPGNMIVRPDGSVMLTDFGIARSDDAVSLTLTGDFAGTPSYCSPEQLRARGIDHRTDIFSLGATLYELLTLQKPFAADTISEIRERIERQEPKPPSRLNRTVPRDLDSIVLHALEKAPAARYQTALEFADDLRRWREGRPVRARPVGVPVRTVRWCKRNPIAAGFLATTTAGLLVVLLLAVEMQRKGALAEDRLVQFRSMKVERDIKLLEQALASAPGPSPANIAKLREVCTMADDVVGRLPALRQVLDDLRRLGSASTEVAPHRLLTAHPAAAALVRLQADRGAIARRLGELVAEGRASPGWQTAVEARLHDFDGRIEQLRRKIQARRAVAFTDPEVEYLHDTVEDDIAELEWLEAERMPELRRRTAWAVELAAAPTGAEATAWAEARAVAGRAEPYGGLDLVPQPGLVPLGVDPTSGLLEFAHRRSGKVPQRDARGELQLDGDSCLVFVLIPGGATQIGSQRSDANAPFFAAESNDNESPVRLVQLDPFLLCKHELGHAQWNRLAAGLGVFHQCAYFEGREDWETKPIARVTWIDCDRLCRAHGFVLPTESQWEHACRAGTTTPWWVGEDPELLEDRENVAGGGRVAIYAMSPNPFGLYQMSGNVQEWCADPMIDYDWQARRGDGLRAGAVDGDQHAVRGGFYLRGPDMARSAKRNTNGALDQKDILGLRPAMQLLQAK
ncbi:MAG TPA: bifunctional serine/threonine-protein kinase/formylglycine-generating enzyme family protein [Planctomycetota bacterium]|nr:bifunctional serine/threonine-protein kinase/formylglycine-generating enzyme family protein [Planctomycetota bacterium]